MRIVEDVTRMSNIMNTPINFQRVVKVAALLHDIGRFPQAVYNNDFKDATAVNFDEDEKNHAKHGYNMLTKQHGFDDYDISKKYQFAIAEAVRYHQNAQLPEQYNLQFENSAELDADNFLSGNELLNENEKVIVAAILQMVKDVDMLDILYQHLTGEFPPYRNVIYYKTYDPKNPTVRDSLQTIAKHFDVSTSDLREFNDLKTDDISGLNSIAIPVSIIPIDKLQIAKDIKDRFLANEVLDLGELTNRRDYTFVTGMWWRLNKFLNSIMFTSNLEIVEETRLLDRIYNIYPDELKPLVSEAFDFAKEKLIEKVITENKDQIYIRR